MRLPRTGLIVAGIIGAVVASLAYAAVPDDGLAADHAPGRVETAIARRLVALSIPADATSLANPNGSNPDAWRRGVEHFAEHCVLCHGSDGRGRSELGPNFYPPVPDLASPAIQDLSDGALFAVISHGIRWTGMPAFRSGHSDDEIWTLVSFVRHIPQMPENQETTRQ